MLAIVIILIVVAVIELIVCLAIHFDRAKTHAVYTFMADMVAEEGGALQKALEDLKNTSKYAEPSESAAAISEISRFLESFNSTVRKQVERIEESQRNKWHKKITGLVKKKKVEYKLPSKKKADEEKKEKKEEEEEEIPAETPGTDEEKEEFAKIEEKVGKKLEEREEKPKKIRRLKKRFRKVKPGESKPSTESAEAEEEGGTKTPGDTDTDVDLAPPSE